MGSSNAVFYWLGLEATVGMLWVFIYLRAFLKLQAAVLFPGERPLQPVEFWRYLASTLLLFVIVAFIMVNVSSYDVRVPIYRHPEAIARLFATQLVMGSFFVLYTWSFMKWASARIAKFHVPTLPTWEKFWFWGPPRRKQTNEERLLWLRKMGWFDYAETLGLFFCLASMLPFFLLWMELLISDISATTLASVLKSFFATLFQVEWALAVLTIIFGSIVWLSQRLFVWLGWGRTLV